MRCAIGFLLALALPLQAQELSEPEQLVWFNYHLAVAEAPGDVHSDQRMARMLALTESIARASNSGATPASEPMRAYLARAQVVAAELEANVEAARDSDPFLLGADLGCSPGTDDGSTCDRRRAKLEPFVAGNAYHGVVLMVQAWIRKDSDGFLRAARLAAAAPTYDGVPAFGFRSLAQRYRQVRLPATLEMNALTRTHAPEVLAMALSSATAFSSYQHFSQPCRESEGELRGHCLAIGRKMMSQGQHPLDVAIGMSVVRALGAPEDIAQAEARKREVDWLRAKSFPLLVAAEDFAVAGMDEYFTVFGNEGEFAAMRALLEVHGIAVMPPADWTPEPVKPVAAK